jgi:hypothetical protein
MSRKASLQACVRAPARCARLAWRAYSGCTSRKAAEVKVTRTTHHHDELHAAVAGHQLDAVRNSRRPPLCTGGGAGRSGSGLPYSCSASLRCHISVRSDQWPPAPASGHGS